MAIKSIDREICIGCGTCRDICAMDVIAMDADGKAMIKYPTECIVCTASKTVLSEQSMYPPKNTINSFRHGVDSFKETRHFRKRSVL